MASAGLDTMITVKVNFHGTTRRTKMPLRDMVPGTLESNIRTFLHIPSEAETVFERYSDSASSFVQLTPGNIPVYKQLYRAAKAKSKLKIRVSLREPVEKITPKPVSVEDEPEASSSSPAPETPSDEKSQDMSQEIKKQVCPAPTPASDAPPSIPKPLFMGELGSGFTSSNIFGQPSDNEKPRECAPGFDSPFNTAPYRPRPLGPLPNEWNNWSTTLPTRRLPSVSLPVCPAAGANFAVCCNNCEKTIPDMHYHCSTCDDGDFDLCQACVNEGVSCYGADHWLIKRTTRNGQIVQSHTETIAPKVQKEEAKPEPVVETPKEEEKPEPEVEVEEEPKEDIKEEAKEEVKEESKIKAEMQPIIDVLSLPKPTFEPLVTRWATLTNMRTCNCCVQELPESEFLHCTTCDDFDLCQPCFAKDGHGHHPKHAFVPAVEGTVMPEHIKVKMSAGRNQLHHAICDGCDKYITGVRHKCLDCPDWDYCASCNENSSFIHPNHRFVPVYDHLANIRARTPQAVHVGICCDGPLCAEANAYPAYIRGIRYKCAVCHDLDFCANCEANPSNTHNKTHPLIKFKTPVRHVSVTTTGEHHNGQRMPTMGDRRIKPAVTSENTINAVQTVVDVKPVDPAPVKEEEKPDSEKDLRAIFIQDTIEDGTIMPPNYAFQQTWVLRNTGEDAWPAGCSVRFVGGDYMGHVDSNHPAGISELVSASESTVCYAPLKPGQEFSFSVLLRTPSRPGKLISYWRLTSPSGHKFGHRLWCDVNVRLVKESSIRASTPPSQEEAKEEAKEEIKEEIEEETKEPVVEEPVVEEPEEEEAKKEEESLASSQMIFPKLEKESPVASIHVSEEPSPKVEQYEDAEDDEWVASDDGFMTDEEYDILDASDEEWLEEQKKKLRK